MGITAAGVILIMDHIQGADVLCLGYPDIIPHKLPYKPKIVPRLSQHGGGECIDTEEFFSKMGAKSVRYVDVKAFHGKEDELDLNYPHNLGEYDLILDPGTLEHCFNIGQAWKNVIESVRVGGYVYHNNPVTMINHGFWNFSPTVYNDVYLQNGFDCDFVLERGGVTYRTPDLTRRMKIEPEAVSHVLARRLEAKAFKYPTQDKYLDL